MMKLNIQMTKKKWIIAGVVGIVLLIILVSLIFGTPGGAIADLQTEPLGRGQLTAIVGATGSVHANQSTVLAWQTSGRIGSIDVEIGDEVAADAILATLASSSLPQSIILSQADLVTAQRTLENLESSTLAQAQAALALADAQEALNTAQNRSITQTVRRGTDEQIDEYQNEFNIAQSNYNQAREIFLMVQSYPATDPNYAYALSNLMQAQRVLDTATYNLDYLQNNYNDQEVTQSQAELSVAQAQYEDALREWHRLENGPDPNDVLAAQARVDALQASIGMGQLTAPFAGTVTDISSQVGDQVSPGTVSFRVDDLSHLLVDVLISEVDINRVQVGQSATLSFDAIQSRSYTGEVIDVARVGVVTQGVVNFGVTVELTDGDEAVLPGMTAAVNIVVNQLDDILLIPNRAVRLRDGVRVVYVLRGNVPVMVPIEIGASSDLYSELVSGEIEEGEAIILNPSADFSSGPMSGGPFGG